MLTLAISRGRIWNEALPLLNYIGLAPDAAALNTRQLIIPTANPQVRLLQVRAQDAPTFIACGAAQAGIVGRDVLAERKIAEVICPLDLRFGRCRLSVAAAQNFNIQTAGEKILTVATKYPNLTRDYFAERGLPINVIKLHGALELSPHVGVADIIVDLVDSGQTLRENGLQEKETILQVSAIWVVNRIAARRLPVLADLQHKITEYLAAND